MKSLMLVLVGLLAIPALAQTKPKPKSGGAVVQGTTQLPGDFGRLGTTYTLGKASPLNVQLRSAEYSLGRAFVPFLDEFHLVPPPPGKKWLILHLTVQNPRRADVRFWYQALRLIAVHADGSNHEPTLMTPFTKERDSHGVDQAILPGERLDVTIALPVPAAGAIRKLIIERERGLPVVRFNMAGQISPLPTAVADPADATGATALERLPATMGTFYPHWLYDTKVTQLSWPEQALDPEMPASPPAQTEFFACQLQFRATGARERHTTPYGIALRGSVMREGVTLTLEDGQTLPVQSGLGTGGFYADSRRALLDTLPEAEDTVTGRVYFAVPKGATPTKLTLRLAGSRPLVYTITREMLTR